MSAGLVREAIELVENKLDAATRAGDADTPYAVNLMDLLFGIHRDTGNLAVAAELGERSLEHKRRVLRSDPRVAHSANNLAEIYRRSGSYTKAHALFLEALAIEEHPVVWGNLGLLYFALGKYEPAEECVRHALEADLKELGPDDPGTAISQDNLAAILLEIAETQDADAAVATLAEAESLLDAAASTLQSRGPSLSLLRCLVNRSSGLRRVNRVDDAIAAGTAAVELAESLEPADGLLSTALVELAAACRLKGNNGDEEAMLRRAIDVAPGAAASLKALSLLADVYLRQRRHEEAVAAVMEALHLDQARLASLVGGEAEDQRARACREPWERVRRLLGIHLTDPSAIAAQAVVELVLRWKDLESDVEWFFADTIRHSDDEDAIQAFAALKDHQDRMVETALRGPGVEISPFYDLVERQEHDLVLLRGDLATVLSARGIPDALEQRLTRWLESISVGDVARKLPAGAVLAIFARAALPGSGDEIDERTVALTIDQRAGPLIIDLGPTRDLDLTIGLQLARSDGVSRDIVRRRQPARPAPDLSPLRERVLDPILTAYPDASSFLLVPDGAMWAIPFDALPLDDERHVIEAYAISLLRDGRSVLDFGHVGEHTPPLVVGGPDYDLDYDIQIGLTRFPPLPGSVLEAEQIADLLGVTPVRGADAIKSVLTDASSPVILHLATHGVYDVEDTELERFSPMPWKVMSEALIGSGYHDRVRFWERNPMFRSMLVFAGANAFLDGHDLPARAGTALVTAAELMMLDLSGTELAVLSACSTMRGDTDGGGIRGLASALAQAGANTAVLSLWPIPDSATQSLMSSYYEHLLSGVSRVEALRAAKLELKRGGLPTWQWAAFESIGEPGPLPETLLHSVP